MSTKKPWFPLYAADYLTDTQAMPAMAWSIYTRMIFSSWVNGSLADPMAGKAELHEIAYLCNCGPQDVTDAWPIVGPKFERTDDGRIHSPRLERERERADKISKGKAVGGRASAASRRKNPSGNSEKEHLFPFAGTNDEQKATQSQSQSQLQLREDPPTPRSRGKRATRLPEDWKPDGKLHAECKLKFPKVDLKSETEKFKDYFIGKGRTYVDWRRTWRNWMRRASESLHTSKTRWTFKMAEDFCIREHLTRHKGESNDAFTDRMRSRAEQGPQ